MSTRVPRRAATLRAAAAAGVLIASMAAAVDDALAQARKARSVHGAVAYHRASSAHGYAYDYPNERAARAAALRECGHPACEVMVAFSNACGAVADGPVKQATAARGATADEADARALKACGDPACRVVAWSCTK